MLLRKINLVTGKNVRRAPREGEDPTNPNPGPNPNPNPNPQPGAGGGEIKFTPEQQTKINALLADERRKTEQKAQQANQQTIQELTQLRNNVNLSQQEKDALNTQIEQLQTQFQTKEQQQQTEYQKLQTKYKTDTEAKDKEVGTWKSRFETKLKQVDLRAAAEKYKAVNASQIEKMLWDLTEVEPELDANGKATANMVTRVNWSGKDKDGNVVKLKLSPADAVKAMTETPDEWGNLFENSARSGLNGGTNNGGGGSNRLPNIENMTPQEWLKNRGKIREQMNATGT